MQSAESAINTQYKFARNKQAANEAVEAATQEKWVKEAEESRKKTDSAIDESKAKSCLAVGSAGSQAVRQNACAMSDACAAHTATNPWSRWIILTIPGCVVRCAATQEQEHKTQASSRKCATRKRVQYLRSRVPRKFTRSEDANKSATCLRDGRDCAPELAVWRMEKLRPVVHGSHCEYENKLALTPLCV